MQEQRKNKIHYSVKALRDLDEIWDYIVTELCNISAAEKVVDGIMDAVNQLAVFAEIGAPITSIANVDSDYRFIVKGNYIALYRVYDHDVYVDRVLFGRRDYLHMLFGNMLEDTTTE